MRIISEKIGLWDMGYNERSLNWKDNGKSQKPINATYNLWALRLKLQDD
ncbi:MULTISPECIES: hypothetical protein [Nostocales]|jgi:hypothetical protein|uniref:Uncharacterized protein n=1 Tax=Aphanizomenon flos-aquae FACHB-1040 TaxID=2692887 RepID=A0ABR8BVH0_APHFL|nr:MULTISPECIES: hypothetical protein [Nostocales]MBD2278426.1 hypothetical protein [Aphanizomenon flos-aquae FACHB-1040]MBO1065315.1 hypothetical protein [Anabaena sp. 54]MBO1072544.1 hypothetical protein [Dolichospermum sp. DEX189]MCX5984357.1 hypothetical protein [Nostocales cyanobacterium LacPavin_0920_SED1_MAG_38_18]